MVISSSSSYAFFCFLLLLLFFLLKVCRSCLLLHTNVSLLLPFFIFFVLTLPLFEQIFAFVSFLFFFFFFSRLTEVLVGVGNLFFNFFSFYGRGYFFNASSFFFISAQVFYFLCWSSFFVIVVVEC